MKNTKFINKENIILLFIPVILTIYMRFGMANQFSFYFHSLFSSSTTLSFFRVFYEYIFVFVTQAIIPILLIVFVFKESPSNYGLQIGDSKKGFSIVFMLLVPIGIILLLTALVPDSKPPVFHSVYPAIPAVKNSLPLFFLNTFFLIFYYAGFEIFYRGFILFGLKDKFGAIPAILIQAIPSVLIHIHKPDGEIFGALVAEVFFGYLALKTESIYYGFFIHLFIGIGIELATILF